MAVSTPAWISVRIGYCPASPSGSRMRVIVSPEVIARVSTRETRCDFRLRRPLTKELRRWHPRANALQLLDGNPVKAVLTARLLDRTGDHAPDEGRDLLHPR